MTLAAVSPSTLAAAVRRFTNADSLYRQKYCYTRKEAEYLAQLLEEAARRLETAQQQGGPPDH